ncbi:MAG: PBP1A family penicillin-binding protein [Candidatus Tectomicrobia bacterium]|uniref:Penicillin-binding protein 1A n=1 Tax=Tectimicrobiota bacterium TaxID=2528274 RepID=A0A932HZY1_UNCTE|nr:PBP1A family penicillin-binding protein [Candidatus Tectomicrobia bacterium]
MSRRPRRLNAPSLRREPALTGPAVEGERARARRRLRSRPKPPPAGDASPSSTSGKASSARRRGGFPRAMRGFLAFVLLGATVAAVAAAAGGIAYYRKVARELPDVELLRTYRPSLVTRVFDQHGGLVREFFVERRFLLPLEEIPRNVIQATIATEDSRFEEHPGVDVIGIGRAALRNIAGGEIVQGGSTITQQLAKTLFLTPERSLDRKLREAVLAFRIESRFGKREILNLYLNQIYYGHGAYGIEAAARVYFGKGAKDLTLPEAALLAGLPRAPNTYSPFRSLDRAKRRRAHVLRRMYAEGYISGMERDLSARALVRLAKVPPSGGEAEYAIEEARRQAGRLVGTQRFYRDGLRIHTTIHSDIQREATSALRKGLQEVDRRRGYRGPIGRVSLRWSEDRIWNFVAIFLAQREEWPEFRAGRWEPAVVTKVSRRRADLKLRGAEGFLLLEDAEWARPFDPSRNGLGDKLANLEEALRPGDVVLAERLPANGKPEAAPARVRLVQEPQVQGAVVVLEPRTGAIRAMVGGYDFERSRFNRATQAVRPPGSAFKPFVYLASLREGWTPSDIILDAPVIFPSEGGEWKPTNFEERFFGPTTLLDAITYSRNVVTVKLASAIGVRKIIRRARELGIRSPLKPNLSLALGSNGVTLLELASAYGTLANGGVRVEPHLLQRVEDAAGRAIWGVSPAVRRSVPPEEAYVMVDLLQRVVEAGTASRARELKRPLAGKTGTTNDYQDAWFVGISPLFAVGVWVGMDDKSTLGRNETGGRTALPIWMEVMASLHEGLPAMDFQRPQKVSMVYVNPRTGARLPREEPGGVWQAYLPGSEPDFAPRQVRPDDLKAFAAEPEAAGPAPREPEELSLAEQGGGPPGPGEAEGPGFNPFRGDQGR